MTTADRTPQISSYRLINDRGRSTGWGTKVVFADGWVTRLGRRVDGAAEAIRQAEAIRAEERAALPNPFKAGTTGYHAWDESGAVLDGRAEWLPSPDAGYWGTAAEVEQAAGEFEATARSEAGLLG